MSDLNIVLLGSPKIFLNGELCSFRTRKAIALAAYLAVTQQIHRRESLIALFWPDSNSARGKNSLRQTLVRLRKVLGDQWFDIKRQTVGINWEQNVTVDVLHFQKLVDAKELTAYEEAIGLYHSDFLTGLTLRNSPLFDEWQFFEQERLRQLFANALETAVQLGMHNNQFELAIRYAQRWVALDALNEVAQRQLMKLFAQAGQRSDAIQQYEACKAILADELGVEPDPETATLYDEILHGRITAERPTIPEKQVKTEAEATEEPPSSAPRHNLPTMATSFVGREDELAEINVLLADKSCRMVTLLGLGGIGKTRLAVQTAVSQLDHFANGVWLVDLAPIRSVHFIQTAVATAIGLTFEGNEEPKQQLAAYLRDKELLLLFDNFEHLLDGADLLSYLLGQAPRLKVLVTSREQLRLAEEWLYDVRGLPYPDEVLPSAATPQRNLLPGKSAASYSAVQLFIQRARQAKHNFSLIEAEKDVIRICHLVEGMPLGLELAAAWVRMLTCAQIASEIGQSLDFLATDQRNVVDRHRSIRAVFEYSWQMLSPLEQKVLAKLSVFRGGFSQEAAAAVADASIFVLYALLNKSLLRRNVSGRYEMHELLRQFAADKLGDPDETMGQHSRYFASWLQQHEPNLFDTRQSKTLSLIGQDIENCYHAWLWSAQQGELVSLGQALHSLYNYHALRNLNEQGQQLFQRVLTLLEPYLQVTKAENNPILIRLIARQSEFMQMMGKQMEAGNLLRQALGLAQQMRLPEEELLCHLNLGILTNSLGAYVEAKEHLQAAYDLSVAQADRHHEAFSLMTLGTVEQALGNFKQAKEIHQTCLALYERLGYEFGIMHTERYLGQTAHQLGAYEKASTHYQRSLSKAQELSYEAGIALACNYLAEVTQALGAQNDAIQLFRQGYVHSQNSKMPAIEAIALHGMGRFLLTTGQSRQGERLLNQALKTAVSIHKTPLTLDILLDMALQLDDGHHGVPPQQIVHLIEQHSASRWDTQEKAKQARALLPTPKANSALPAPVYKLDENGALQWIVTQIMGQG